MNARDFKYFKERLLERQNSLIALVQKTQNYGREADSDNEAMDIADKAASSYTKEFMFSKSSSDRLLLQTVEEALQRIEEGTYGECQNCGETVERKRLEAVPWARLCLSCQEKEETGRL